MKHARIPGLPASAGLLALVALVALVALAPACSKSGEPNEEKRLPRLHPPPTVTIPADIHIDVVIDDQAAPAIESARLRDVPPDYADDQRSAWRLDSLIAGIAATTGEAGLRFSIAGDRGVSVTFDLAATAPARVPVLLLNRRGDLLVIMVDPENPFPAYHGAGGRLARPGDELPHVTGVKRIRVDHAAGPPPSP